jgi:uncharacterized membrane protein YphA (DoxX/SURF4 family)
MATPEAAAGRPGNSAARLSASLERINWIAVLRIALGALFVSVFFENVNKKLYTPDGYAGLIRGYEREGNAPGVWKDFMGFIADHSSLFAPVQAVFELTLGILLVLGIGSGLVALISGGHLSALWISELAPRRWVWELLSLVVIAVVVGLASLPSLLDDRRPLTARILGPPTFRAGPLASRLVVAFVCGAALAGAILAAKTGGDAHYKEIAWQSGATFGGLMIALGVLDNVRARPDERARP